MERRWRWVAIPLVFILLLAACGGAQEPTPQPTLAPAQATQAPVATPIATAAPTAEPDFGAVNVAGKATGFVVTERDIEEAKYGGTIRGFLYNEAVSLDPTALTGPTGSDIAGGIYDNLIHWNPFNPSETRPELAESWSVDDAGKVYTFKLRKDVKWHDGMPFTAADVEATFNYWTHAWNTYKKTQRVGGYITPLMESWRAVDQNTFEVTLKAPASQFVSIIASAHYSIYPKHKVDPFLELTSYDPIFTGDERPPVGTGPFKYDNYTHGVGMTWTRNDSYWRQDPQGRSLPYLDAVSEVLIMNDQTSFAALRVGQIDFWTPYPQMRASQVRSLEKALGDKIRVYRGPSLLLEGMNINMGDTWLPARERDFRWALNLIIDRDEFYERVFETEILSGRILDSRVWPGFALPEEEQMKSPWRNPDLKARHAEAKQLLDGLGFDPKTFPTIRVVGRASSFFCDYSELVGVQLNNYGFDAKVTCPSSAAKRAITTTGKYALSGQGTGTTVPDAIIAMQNRYENKIGYNEWVGVDGKMAAASAKIVGLIADASFALDPAGKQKALYDIQRVIYFEDVPNIELGWSNALVPVWAHVRGMTLYGGSYEPRVQAYTWLDK
jgi:ABC-type transport system substrate-binding protein